jgi:hypothetical protein
MCGLASATISFPAQAQESASSETTLPAPVTIEGYYKIRWGAEQEFFALYQKNHLPILEEAKARGIIKEIRIDLPYNHMAGGERWDLRVAITYRSAEAALLVDPEFVAVFDEMVAQLKRDNPDFDDEEARRFSLLDEHWDIILMAQS